VTEGKLLELLYIKRGHLLNGSHYSDWGAGRQHGAQLGGKLWLFCAESIPPAKEYHEGYAP